MKKVTSKTNITFRVDGSTVYDISPEGVLCSDEHAKFLVSRLGGNIRVEEVDVVKAAKEVVDKVVKSISEEEIVEESLESPEEVVDTSAKGKKK